MQYHALSIKDSLHLLKSSRSGLTSTEANIRLEENGSNSLPRPKGVSVITLFIRQITSPLILILIFAFVLSLFFKEGLNAVIIGLIVFINLILAIFEELRAKTSLESLRNVLPVSARVVRDGEIVNVDAESIVTGDMLKLKSGDRIVADARIVSCSNFSSVEASLTGESQPQEKRSDVIDAGATVSDRSNMVFSGTLVASGEADAVVVATGINTEIGKITRLIYEVGDENTPLKMQLSRLAKSIGLSSIILGLVAVLSGYINGYDIPELLSTSVALAVAIVPEGLAIGLTVVLSISMQRILKKKALVRTLMAAETLGSVQVICFDKTGTITTGKMTVSESFWLGDFKDQGMRSLRTANCLEEGLATSPTEIAICDFVHDVKPFDVVGDRLPFDSSRKYTAFKSDEGLFVIGAPEVLLKMSDMSDDDAEIVNSKLNEFLKDGYRILAVGKTLKDQSLDVGVEDVQIIGLLGLEDPVRENAKDSISEAIESGVIPVMITGDHPETARRVAEEVGIIDFGGSVISGSEIDKIGDKELALLVRDSRVFARVLPEHKVRIVNAWHMNGFSVAMTGDGVNDAPAIRVADIGVAFGSGTEVAKDVADMVLLDDNFSTINSAIEEGRTAFDNIRKVTAYMLLTNFTEVILIVSAIFLGMPLPLTPIQILWINLVSDGIPAISLMFEPVEKGVMKDGPRSADEKIVNHTILLMIIFVGICSAVLMLLLYIFMDMNGYSLEDIRSTMYFGVALNSLIQIFSIRTLRVSIFRSKPWQNKYLIPSFMVSLIIQFLPVALPVMATAFGLGMISFSNLVIILIIAITQLAIIEWIKWINGGVRVKNHV